ncbi:MAG: hypoxanthine phosphoribosyltransferase [Verrucomicrobiae bacterium]|nr:hypoxanthine phosphoribosyltransferase [Verrucomicrobiae bacterium]
MIGQNETILITQEAIQKRVTALAAQITQDYEDKELTILALMKGSVVFLADLLRLIPIPLRLEVLPVSSYHGGTETSGVVTFATHFLPDIVDHHVLLIDDILDSGTTLKAITACILEQKPASLRSCVLLHKKVKTQPGIKAEYVGFEIPDAFVVGYGLDYQEYYRNLPEIRVLSAETIAQRSQK